MNGEDGGGWRVLSIVNHPRLALITRTVTLVRRWRSSALVPKRNVRTKRNIYPPPFAGQIRIRRPSWKDRGSIFENDKKRTHYFTIIGEITASVGYDGRLFAVVPESTLFGAPEKIARLLLNYLASTRPRFHSSRGEREREPEIQPEDDAIRQSVY